MGKNTILNVTLIFCWIMRAMCAFVGCIMLIFFISVIVSPSAYDDCYMDCAVRDGKIEQIFNVEQTETEKSCDVRTYKVSDITTFSLYYTCMQLIGLLVLSYLVLLEFSRVLQSVKSLTTFQDRNVKAFRRIGWYLLGCFFLELYYYVDLGDASFSGFMFGNIGLFPVFLAFIFAEIFKEGNRLQEENQLTV
ncbi:MAG: DUF2975 domain-containing protein [Flavobacteriaceae bacterium]|nr:DUF2975 domain-containing protein [Flavobacteriaceae bacterium]